MGKKRIRHSAEFKAKAALEALKGLKTVNELAGQYQVHPTQISQWKRQFAPRVVSRTRHYSGQCNKDHLGRENRQGG